MGHSLMTIRLQKASNRNRRNLGGVLSGRKGGVFFCGEMLGVWLGNLREPVGNP